MLSEKEIDNYYKRGVTVDELGDGQLRFFCLQCGINFAPNLASGGDYPRGYWICPNKCNKGASKWKKSEQYKLPIE